MTTRSLLRALSQRHHDLSIPEASDEESWLSGLRLDAQLVTAAVVAAAAGDGVAVVAVDGNADVLQPCTPSKLTQNIGTTACLCHVERGAEAVEDDWRVALHPSSFTGGGFTFLSAHSAE